MKVRWLMCLVTMSFLYAGITGCARPTAPLVAQVPVPTGYHLSTQSKMQSVHHWDVLAEDATSEIRRALVAFLPDHYRSVFVAASGLAPFEKAFQELLITHLVNHGFLVSRDPQDALVLSFELQLVTHHPNRFQTVSGRRAAGRYATLVPGVYVDRNTPLAGERRQIRIAERHVANSRVSAEAGAYTLDLPRNEVLVTLSLTDGDVFIYRKSIGYYINDADWWHYRSGMQRRQQPAASTFNLVDR